MRIRIAFTIMTLGGFACRALASDPGESQARQQADRKAFEQVAAGPWKDVFSDTCTGDWTKLWFLDGEIGTVKTGPDGMTLTAGPEAKNDAHHMVLWTRDVTVIKNDRDLFMRVENPDQVYHCPMTNHKLPVITQGRIGLRHMFTRSARSGNFSISTPAARKP